MGTRSYIAKQIAPDQYRTIYCQFDGYLEEVGANLAAHYDTAEQLDKLLDLGDIRSLQAKLSPDPSLPHDAVNHQKDVTVAFARDLGCDQCAATVKTMDELVDNPDFVEFVYIFTLDEEWKYFHCDQFDEGMRDLISTLDHMGVEFRPDDEIKELFHEQTEPDDEDEDFAGMGMGAL